MENLISLLPWIIPIAGAISGAVAWVLTYRNREAIAEAEALKTRAEVDSMASTEWQRLYDRLEAKCKQYDVRLDDIEQENRSLNRHVLNLQLKLEKTESELTKTREKLSLTEMSLDIALSWINDYTPALKDAGITPPEVPNPRYRGGDKE